jgi:hypothetical protein
MKRSFSIPPGIVCALISLAALSGMALVIYATRYGPGVGGDSTIYFTAARNLLLGKGLTWIEADGSLRLLPYFPPFYPLVLSAISLITRADVFHIARWLNVFLFGATILLVGWQFFRITGRAWGAAVLAGLLATSPVLVGVEVLAMAEPLTYLCGFGGLFLLLKYLDCPRPWTLAGAALLVGLAFLTRYVGAAFVGAAGLALLFLSRGSDPRVRLTINRRVLREALLFAVLAFLPILIWLLIDVSGTGSVGSRSGQPVAAYLRRFLAIGPALEQVILFWLLPESVVARLPVVLRPLLWLIPVAAFVALSIMVTVRLRRQPGSLPGSQNEQAATRLHEQEGLSTPAVRLSLVLGLFITVYLALLAVAQVFTYPPITLDMRMFSPVHLAILVMVFTMVHLALRLYAPGARLPVFAAGFIALALLGSYALRGMLVARNYHTIGIGYTAVAWQESEVMGQLRRLPASIPIISHDSAAVMFFTGRPAYVVQEIYQDRPLEVFAPYGSGNDEAQRVFREEGGALVLIKHSILADFAKYGPRAADRIEALTSGLVLCYEGWDGAIYFYNPPVLPETICPTVSR